jgi:hypothetical protein
MTDRLTQRGLLAAALWLMGCSDDPSGAEQQSPRPLDTGVEEQRMPEYTADGALVRVQDWPDWIFLA